MTIATTMATVSYVGNGATIVFDFAFPIPSGALVVTLTEGSTVTTLDSSDYSASGLDSDSGGTVTLTTAPTSAQTVTISRQTPQVQDTVLVSGAALYAEVMETALDRQVMMVQDMAATLDRVVKVPVGSGIDPDDYLDSIVTTATASAASASASAASAADAAAAAQIAIGNASASPVTAASATVARSLADRFGDMLTPQDFGAVGDTRYVRDGVITAGSSTVTSATLSPTSADIGKAVTILGGGTRRMACTATVSGTTMTVSAVTTGTISKGQRLFGPGLPAFTFVKAFLTGTGGTGTYTLSTSSTIASAVTLVDAEPLNTTITAVAAGAITLADEPVSSITNGFVSVGTDDTAAMQAWLDALCQFGDESLSVPAGICGFLPKGRYKITAGLTCGVDGFWFPNVYTTGAEYCIIDAWALYYTSGTNVPAITMTGGSPGGGGNAWGPTRLDCGSHSDHNIGFRSHGRGWYRLDGWQFSGVEVAAELYNSGSAFTEGFTFNRCHFTDQVVTALRYAIASDATQPSFRSSGLTGDCAIGTWGFPHAQPIVIEANPVSAGGPYFSPLEATFWCEDNGTDLPNGLIRNNHVSPALFPSFVGKITIEGRPAAYATGGLVYFCGPVQVTGGNIAHVAGSFRRANFFQHKAGGGVIYDAPVQSYAAVTTTGTIDIAIPTFAFETTLHSIRVELWNDAGTYRYVLSTATLCVRAGTDTPSINGSIGFALAFDQLAWGAPTTSFVSGPTMRVTNTNWVGQTINVVVHLAPQHSNAPRINF